ncbi:hypothetical protein T01_15830 [Trichinella spiralis]|uniref:Uncharacterized protein n=1 Tax=Trichinella spiralis TaxID=6334 RepID=A0A0V1BTH8_TRISP|nr:hypothetical protein T01_67 [Trichinella spiralis]KRY40585.1 hypothetical protein T01_15830 [Trichinella spiralis]
MRSEEDFHQRRQSYTGNPKPEETEASQSIDACACEVRGEQAFPEAGKAGAGGCTTRRKKRRLF